MTPKTTIFRGFSPKTASGVFIAPGAQIIGMVELDKNVSVWHNAVLRGDAAHITIGENSNIQDNSVLHCDKKMDLTIGKNVTVGHSATLHSCAIGDGCLIGMGAILLNKVKIGKNCLIAAGTLLTQNTVIPANSMVMGSPGKVTRTLTEEEIRTIQSNAKSYVELAQEYLHL
ncbi:MAG TPA: gamma carbonic anhydrase family protein [Ruminococcaceae bacterium]|nr:gamma carbonic anhydrase family protein [Oscillospiraceae bacterium]